MVAEVSRIFCCSYEDIIPSPRELARSYRYCAHQKIVYNKSIDTMIKATNKINSNFKFIFVAGGKWGELNF